MADRIGYSVPVSVARPADTAAYTANDVIGEATNETAALTFQPMGVPGRTIRIIQSELLAEDDGLISGEAAYRLHLYSVTPPSELADNDAFDIPAGDRASYLGFLDLGTPTDLGSTIYVQEEQAKDLLLADDQLFGYLVTIGGYTPTSGRVFRITLHAVAL